MGRGRRGVTRRWASVERLLNGKFLSSRTRAVACAECPDVSPDVETRTQKMAGPSFSFPKAAIFAQHRSQRPQAVRSSRPPGCKHPTRVIVHDAEQVWVGMDGDGLVDEVALFGAARPRFSRDRLANGGGWISPLMIDRGHFAYPVVPSPLAASHLHDLEEGPVLARERCPPSSIDLVWRRSTARAHLSRSPSEHAGC